MERVLKYMLIALAAFSLAACEKTPAGNGSGDASTENGTDQKPVELPVPPDKMDRSNVFYVDFLSDFQEEGSFFKNHTLDPVISHVSADKSVRPALTVIDRVDCQKNVKNPVVDFSMNLRRNVYFSAYGPAAAQIPGAVLIPASKGVGIDGEICPDIRFSGCRMKTGQSGNINVCIYNCHLGKAADLSEILKVRKDVLEEDGILVGTLPSSESSGLQVCLDDAGAALRLHIHETGKERDLFIVCPGNQVCREVRDLQMEFPCMQLVLERF